MAVPMLTLLTLLGAPVQGTQASDPFVERAWPVLEQHCIACHSEPEAEADLDLERFVDGAAAGAEPELWRRVRSVLRQGAMPPRRAPTRPDAAQLAPLVTWIDEHLPPEPRARVTLRRLNRFEYQNAVLDALGVEFRTEDFLPVDPVGGAGHGFDVIADALSMPPLLFEKYLQAADRIALEALPRRAAERVDGAPMRRFGAQELVVGEGNQFVPERGRLVLYSAGHVRVPLRVDRSGLHRIRVRAAGQQAGPDAVRMELRLDGRSLARIEVTGGVDEPEDFDLETRLQLGERRLTVHFVNDYYEPDDPDPTQQDRNLELLSVDVLGPLDVDPRTPFERRFLPEMEVTGNTDGDALEAEGTNIDPAQVVARVASLLWRGPVGDEHLARLMALSQEGDALDARLRAALVASLVSPRFLFRPEPEPADGQALRPLEGNELATRLAAFLWSSIPDEPLLELGSSGRLAIPGVLHDAVDRMLRDPRASRLAPAFAAQWLQLRRLTESLPDPQRFPAFDRGLAELMRRESELYFECVLREDRPLTELLASDFTFANERLARHYGIPGVQGNAMRRVRIPEHLAGMRGGVLSQGAVLTATSNPGRTSPVRRGKWVLEAMLQTPPSPPPPNVDALEETPDDQGTLSLRERLERHRADPACASCHTAMDAYGFALENYDASGAWRDADGPLALDAEVTLEDGQRFSGPGGLLEHLLRGRAFQRGLARHLTTFALGRGLSDADRMAIDDMVQSLSADAGLRDLIHGIVDLSAFRTRTGEAVGR